MIGFLILEHYPATVEGWEAGGEAGTGMGAFQLPHTHEALEIQLFPVLFCSCRDQSEPHRKQEIADLGVGGGRQRASPRARGSSEVVMEGVTQSWSCPSSVLSQFLEPQFP